MQKKKCKNYYYYSDLLRSLLAWQDERNFLSKSCWWRHRKSQNRPDCRPSRLSRTYLELLSKWSRTYLDYLEMIWKSELWNIVRRISFDYIFNMWFGKKIVVKLNKLNCDETILENVNRKYSIEAWRYKFFFFYADSRSWVCRKVYAESSDHNCFILNKYYISFTNI